jgi:hypothetical protein
VSGYRKIEEAVFQLRTLPDVVHYLVPFPIRTLAVGHNGDVGSIGRYDRGYEVSRFVIAGSARDRKRASSTGKKSLKIQDPAMVNVGIGLLLSPSLRIKIEIGPHVLVHQLLQIDSESTIGTHDDVCAHATISRNVPSGISDHNVGWIVSDPMVGSF